MLFTQSTLYQFSSVRTTWFCRNLWAWRHHSRLDCDSGVQSTFEIFGESGLLRQFLSVFGWARKIFGSCKQNQICFDNLRVSSVVLGGFLDNVYKTKKKKKKKRRTAVKPPLPPCSVNKPPTTDAGLSQLPLSNRVRIANVNEAYDRSRGIWSKVALLFTYCYGVHIGSAAIYMFSLR